MNEIRKERQAKNEVPFRSLNERVRAVTDSLDFDGVVEDRDLEDYICECAYETCTERVSLTRGEYEQLRASPIRFAVVPGHVVADIETVIETNERFTVVEKDPGERALAESNDPRS
jgi:hypothetical protein